MAIPHLRRLIRQFAEKAGGGGGAGKGGAGKGGVGRGGGAPTGAGEEDTAAAVRKAIKQIQQGIRPGVSLAAAKKTAEEMRRAKERKELLEEGDQALKMYKWDEAIRIFRPLGTETERLAHAYWGKGNYGEAWTFAAQLPFDSKYSLLWMLRDPFSRQATARHLIQDLGLIEKLKAHVEKEGGNRAEIDKLLAEFRARKKYAKPVLGALQRAQEERAAKIFAGRAREFENRGLKDEAAKQYARAAELCEKLGQWENAWFGYAKAHRLAEAARICIYHRLGKQAAIMFNEGGAPREALLTNMLFQKTIDKLPPAERQRYGEILINAGIRAEDFKRAMDELRARQMPKEAPKPAVAKPAAPPAQAKPAPKPDAPTRAAAPPVKPAAARLPAFEVPRGVPALRPPESAIERTLADLVRDDNPNMFAPYLHGPHSATAIRALLEASPGFVDKVDKIAGMNGTLGLEIAKERTRLLVKVGGEKFVIPELPEKPAVRAPPKPEAPPAAKPVPVVTRPLEAVAKALPAERAVFNLAQILVRGDARLFARAFASAKSHIAAIEALRRSKVKPSQEFVAAVSSLLPDMNPERFDSIVRAEIAELERRISARKAKGESEFSERMQKVVSRFREFRDVDAYVNAAIRGRRPGEIVSVLTYADRTHKPELYEQVLSAIAGNLRAYPKITEPILEPVAKRMRLEPSNFAQMVNERVRILEVKEQAKQREVDMRRERIRQEQEAKATAFAAKVEANRKAAEQQERIRQEQEAKDAEKAQAERDARNAQRETFIGQLALVESAKAGTEMVVRTLHDHRHDLVAHAFVKSRGEQREYVVRALREMPREKTALVTAIAAELHATENPTWLQRLDANVKLGQAERELARREQLAAPSAPSRVAKTARTLISVSGGLAGATSTGLKLAGAGVAGLFRGLGRARAERRVAAAKPKARERKPPVIEVEAEQAVARPGVAAEIATEAAEKERELAEAETAERNGEWARAVNLFGKHSSFGDIARMFLMPTSRGAAVAYIDEHPEVIGDLESELKSRKVEGPMQTIESALADFRLERETRFLVDTGKFTEAAKMLTEAGKYAEAITCHERAGKYRPAVELAFSKVPERIGILWENDAARPHIVEVIRGNPERVRLLKVVLKELDYTNPSELVDMALAEPQSAIAVKLKVAAAGKPPAEAPAEAVKPPSPAAEAAAEISAAEAAAAAKPEVAAKAAVAAPVAEKKPLKNVAERIGVAPEEFRASMTREIAEIVRREEDERYGQIASETRERLKAASPEGRLREISQILASGDYGLLARLDSDYRSQIIEAIDAAGKDAERHIESYEEALASHTQEAVIITGARLITELSDLREAKKAAEAEKAKVAEIPAEGEEERLEDFFAGRPEGTGAEAEAPPAAAEAAAPEVEEKPAAAKAERGRDAGRAKEVAAEGEAAKAEAEKPEAPKPRPEAKPLKAVKNLKLVSSQIEVLSNAGIPQEKWPKTLRPYAGNPEMIIAEDLARQNFFVDAADRYLEIRQSAEIAELAKNAEDPIVAANLFFKAKEHEAAARKYLDGGDPEAAKECLPEPSAPNLLLWAETNKALGNFKEAAQNYIEAGKKREAREIRDRLERMGDFKWAAIVDSLLGEDFHKAQMYAKDGNYEAAFNKFITINKFGKRRSAENRAKAIVKELISRKRYDAAANLLAYWAKTLTGVNSKAASKLYMQAASYKAEIAKPGDAAKLYLSAGRIGDAAKYYEMAAEYSPGMHEEAAKLLEQKGEHRAAAEQYEHEAIDAFGEEEILRANISLATLPGGEKRAVEIRMAEVSANRKRLFEKAAVLYGKNKRTKTEAAECVAMAGNVIKAFDLLKVKAAKGRKFTFRLRKPQGEEARRLLAWERINSLPSKKARKPYRGVLEKQNVLRWAFARSLLGGAEFVSANPRLCEELRKKFDIAQPASINAAYARAAEQEERSGNYAKAAMYCLQTGDRPMIERAERLIAIVYRKSKARAARMWEYAYRMAKDLRLPAVPESDAIKWLENAIDAYADGSYLDKAKGLLEEYLTVEGKRFESAELELSQRSQEIEQMPDGAEKDTAREELAKEVEKLAKERGDVENSKKHFQAYVDHIAKEYGLAAVGYAGSGQMEQAEECIEEIERIGDYKRFEGMMKTAKEQYDEIIEAVVMSNQKEAEKKANLGNFINKLRPRYAEFMLKMHRYNEAAANYAYLGDDAGILKAAERAEKENHLQKAIECRAIAAGYYENRGKYPEFVGQHRIAGALAKKLGLLRDAEDHYTKALDNVGHIAQVPGGENVKELVIKELASVLIKKADRKSIFVFETAREERAVDIDEQNRLRDLKKAEESVELYEKAIAKLEAGEAEKPGTHASRLEDLRDELALAVQHRLGLQLQGETEGLKKVRVPLKFNDDDRIRFYRDAVRLLSQVGTEQRDTAKIADSLRQAGALMKLYRKAGWEESVREATEEYAKLAGTNPKEAVEGVAMCHEILENYEKAAGLRASLKEVKKAGKIPDDFLAT